MSYLGLALPPDGERIRLLEQADRVCKGTFGDLDAYVCRTYNFVQEDTYNELDRICDNAQSYLIYSFM